MSMTITSMPATELPKSSGGSLIDDLRGMTPESVQQFEAEQNALSADAEGGDLEYLPTDGSDPEVAPEQSAAGQDEQSTEKPAQESKPAEAGVKSLVVEGPDGKKLRVKLDLGNEEKLGQVVKTALQAKALQSRVQELSAKAAEAEELSREMSEVQGLVESGGIQALVDYFMDEPGHFEKFVEAERARRNLLDSADPEERVAAQKLADLETRERKLTIQERRQQEAAKKAQEQLSQAEQAQIQTRFEAAFSKHSLAGKLGDAELEETLNEAAFNAINKEVQERIAKGEKITQANMHAITERRFSIIQRGVKGAADAQSKQDTQAAKTKAADAIAARQGAAPQGQPSEAAQAAANYGSGKGSLLDLVSAALRGRR
jgi:hypothetical protein